MCVCVCVEEHTREADQALARNGIRTEIGTAHRRGLEGQEEDEADHVADCLAHGIAR